MSRPISPEQYEPSWQEPDELPEPAPVDRWTCPRCAGTWVRDLQHPDTWITNLRRVQAAHGRRCSRQENAA